MAILDYQNVMFPMLRYAAGCSDCELYDLDGPPAWSGLE